MEKFTYESNGYNRNEVNKFIEEVIKSTEGIVEKCRKQQQEIEKLTEQLTYYKNMEDNLKTMIQKSELISNDMKKMAQKEADVIIMEAKENASKIINASLLSAQKTENKKELIENNMQILKQKLKILIEQQKIIVEELDKLEIQEN